MKTPATPFFKLNTQQQCEKTGFWYLPHSWLYRLQSSFHVKRRLFYQKIAFVLQVTRATLHALSQELTNTRTFRGLVLLLVVAPLVSKAYLLFDPKAIDTTWFHLNYYYLFVNLGSHLMAFFALLGIFFLFPARLKTSYIISAPLGFVLADILQKFFATSNEEYLQTSPFPYVALLVGVVLSSLLCMDYVLYRQHHIRRAWGARMAAIVKAEGIDATSQVAMMETVIKDVEERHYSMY
jgi:hypothetical protein